MTAPARVGGPSPRDPSKDKAAQNDKARRRTAGAERAYARRAQRASNLRGGSASPQQKAVSKAPFVVLVMLVLGAGIAGIMYFSTQAAADTYRLQEARAEAERLTLQMEQLRREVALLESPTDLARRASEMGLVQPSNPARLRQNPDGSIEEFGKPSAPTRSTAAPPPAPETPAPPDAGTTPPAGG
ncbi:hypothetical protein SAMN04488074_113104 [Lentzea albidocapillata subsp. violacea]|uniref:Cell division protein FtsL n=1 Tax=Lentzea albidocapillata subsp. violacea TaxID=128104 RepID=A0A1G9MQB1_9PSEU|nr:hypothetical protein [Lentzea albidocapillata]SDL76482.1 hypothetical protein SAMN04488074_113104 [Lentzea albidocapillata subsp. violacea]